MSDQVDIVITRDTVAPTRAGFGTALMMSHTADWTDTLVHEYSKLLDLADDFAVTDVEYLAAQAYFSQNPRPRKLKVGKCSLSPTQRYLIEVVSPTASKRYTAHVEGVGVTTTDVAFTTGPGAQVVVPTNATNLFTLAAHGHTTGDGPYRFTTSAADLPDGITENTDYWIIVLSSSTFQVAASYADAITETEVTFADDGTGTHTLQTASNDVIAALLVDRLNSVVGKNFTAATTGSNGSLDVHVTADAAGGWFSIQVSVADLEITQNHADPGVATDLAAIALEDDDWYTLLTNYNSNGVVNAAAAWVEAQEMKTYLVDVNESDAVTTAAGNSDTLDDLATSEYERTLGSYHSSPAEFMSSAWAGKILPYSPGSVTPALKPLAGVATDTFTTTQKSRLDARNASRYYVSHGQSITWEGRMAAGAPVFFDYVRDIDWLKSEMAADIMAVLAGAAKVPFTQKGIQMIVNAIRGTLGRAERAGVLAAGWVVTAPDLADISSADKSNRILPDISWSATYTGAVHRVTPVNGVVSL